MNTENKKLTDLIELLDESWDQVAETCSDNPKEMSLYELHAYTVAMCVITKIKEEMIQYIKTGEKKIVPILFDRFGDIF